MKLSRLIAIGAVTLALGTIGALAASPLLMGVGAPPVGGAAPPFPTTQSVAFGAVTPFGYGGSTMAYTNQGVLGVSRWLKITAQVNSSAVSGTYFGIDDRNQLVPCAAITSNKCSSTYGGAATRSATPYTVTVAEYSDSGRTLPTGAQSVITVNTAASTYSFREMTQAARGCSINCEVDNPDGTSGAFNGDVFQLTTLLSQNAILVPYGSKIIARDGYFNPTLLDYRLNVQALPTGSGCPSGGIGANCILIQSENIDATNDANGNPQLKNGFQLGEMHTDSFGAGGDVALLWTFDHLWWLDNVASSAGGVTAFLYPNNTNGYGYSVTNSRIEWGCGVSSSAPDGSIFTNGQGTFTGNHWIACPAASGGLHGGRGLQVSSNGVVLAHQGGATIVGNIFEGMYNDAVDEYGGPNTITDNTMIDWQFEGVNHSDSLQNTGGDNGQNYTGSTILRNFSVRGAGRSGWDDAQQIAFIKNDEGGLASGAGTATYTNMSVKWNLSVLLGGNGYYANTITPTISFNLNFAPTGTSCVTGSCIPDNPIPGDIAMIIGTGGTGGTITQNGSNTFSSTQGGSPTISDNTQTSWSSGSAATIYTSNGWPNYVSGEPSCPQYCNRASIISIMAPAFNNSSTTQAHNADGTYVGPLTPADSGGHPCWNSSITNFDNTKTCAAQGLTQAQ